MLWGTIGTMAMSGVGLLIRTVSRYRAKLFDQRFLQHELAVLEGEGGICLS